MAVKIACVEPLMERKAKKFLRCICCVSVLFAAACGETSINIGGSSSANSISNGNSHSESSFGNNSATSEDSTNSTGESSFGNNSAISASANNSSVSSFNPSATVATPVITPANCNISPYEASSVLVSITCSTPFASIWYTTDGTNPDGVNGTQYTVPFDLPLGGETAVIKAIGHRETFTVSSMAVSTITRTNEEGDPNPNSVLKVNNLDNQRIVLFAAKGLDSSPLGTLLGAVNAGAQGWGVPGVSPTDGMFVLNIVTYQDYNDSLASGTGDPRIAASILVYVDSTPATYSISTSPMGTGYIQYYNGTSNFVEIRGGSVQSSPGWYSPPYAVLRPMESKRIYFPNGDHVLFPVLKIERRGGTDGTTIIGLSERNLTAYAELYSVSDNSAFQVSIPASEQATALDTVALLSVQNNTMRGGRLMVGSTIYLTSLERGVVSSGSSAEYIIQMNTIGSGVSSTTSASRASRFSFSTFEGPIAEMPEAYAFEAGKVYLLTIPANAAAHSIATIVPVALLQ